MNNSKQILILFLITILSVSVFASNGMRQLSSKNSGVQGLEGGLIIAYNASQNRQIEQVMNQIQERHRLRLNETENLQFRINEKTNETVATYQAEGRLFGFLRMNHNYRYIINEDGELTRKKYWYDFLWGENGSDITI